MCLRLAACGAMLLVALTAARAGAEDTERAVLSDEDAAAPLGIPYAGSVVWTVEPADPAGGQSLAIRAEVKIPGRGLKLMMLVRRNSDPSLPASHTIEMTFSGPADFADRGIGSVAGLMLKSGEKAIGTPLQVITVKIADGVFLSGLSNNAIDVGRNVQLLRERAWFDIPIVYANQHRAILAVEKGSSGQQAFEAAFAAWIRPAGDSR
jgi:hypothetical protein